MQIYPGYTVTKIEEELSFREIEELSKCWEKMPPNYANVKITKEIIAGYLGIDLNPKTEETTIEKTIEAFELLGY